MRSVVVPSQPTDVSQRGLRAAANQLPNRPGPFGGVESIDGPSKFVPTANGQTVHNLACVRPDIDGLNGQADTHEMSLIFSVKLIRPDFAGKHVLMNIWQVNLFLREMYTRAIAEYKRDKGELTLSKLSQPYIAREMRKRSSEYLQFLSHRVIAESVCFVGIQFGNRYVNPRSGPGIAVITSGNAMMRNICLNGNVQEQDELWLLLRAEKQNSPLQFVLRSFHGRAPYPADRQYLDESDAVSYGPAIKVGHVVDKPQMDMQSLKVRRMATGLDGSADDYRYAEVNAPELRVVMCTSGIKSMQI